jgi:lipoprotein-anchoring transpeptidase ErfK/SrfK
MSGRLASTRCRVAIDLAAALFAAIGFNACAVASRSATVDRVAAAAAAQDSGPTPEPRLRPYLVLRLGERRLYLVDDAPDTPDESFPIAVGREGSETPVGRFRVEEMVENPDFLKVASGVVVDRIPPGPNNPLGQRWIGFVRGDGWTIGIHGTPHPELLGRAVSRGCVRMRNEDVVGVYDRVQIGTPILVEP